MSAEPLTNVEAVTAAEVTPAARDWLDPLGASKPNIGTASRTVERRRWDSGCTSIDVVSGARVVRVDRLIKHPKYRRYVRRTSKFMAHDEQGATVGDKVRIVETRPLSAHKRWRVVEIIQKAEK